MALLIPFDPVQPPVTLSAPPTVREVADLLGVDENALNAYVSDDGCLWWSDAYPVLRPPTLCNTRASEWVSRRETSGRTQEYIYFSGPVLYMSSDETDA